jgi:hypothetical protein
MKTDSTILPYTLGNQLFEKNVEILGAAFVTVSRLGTPEELQERVMVPLSQQAKDKGGDILLCVRETPLPDGQKSIFMASIGRRPGL